MKWFPVEGCQPGHRRAQFGREMVGVLGHAGKAGKVLQRGANASRFEALRVSERHLRGDGRVAGDGAFVDARVEVPAPRCAAGAKVDHRAEVECDAQIGQCPALLRAVGAGALGELVFGNVRLEQAGQRGLALDDR